jgi:protein SCO1
MEIFVRRNVNRVCRLVGSCVLLSLILVGCGRPHEFAGTELDPPHPATDFSGVNWDGTSFHLSDLRGKVVLFFFGYTTCPDVCPLTLAEMQAIEKDLGEQAADVEIVFVTVDPERDTIERLAQYIPAFDSTFYGVRLDETTLAATKKAYGIYAEKVVNESETSAVGYMVDHSGYTLLIDTQGNWRVIYSYEIDASAIAQDIRYLLTE